jgi:hypothetical protein
MIRFSGFFIALSILILPVGLQGQGSEKVKSDKPKETTFTIGGYAKLDLLVTNFRNGVPEIDNPILDIHIPGSIPVGDGLSGYDTQIHAKESRFNFEVKSSILGEPIRVFFEMDFLLSKGGDQRVSNSYNPRLRHFFFQYKRWTFGQTWTTFMTTAALPDAIIFPGSTDGLIFNRQAMVRYSYKNWDFSFENPESTLLPYQGGKFITSSGGIPDVVVKHTFNGDWGLIGLAGVFRVLRGGHEDEHVVHGTGFGLNISGKFYAGARDDVRFMITYGEGLGRYIGMAFITGAALNQEGHLSSIGSTNAVLSYLHHWNAHWRSGISYSFFRAEDNSALTGGTANSYSWSGYVSLLYEPDPKLLFGVQIMYGYRQLENSVDGAMIRLQFSAKYNFSYSHTIYHKSE